MHTVVGRDDAVTIVGAELEKRQLLTITGPGGIGKTTVAIATANHHAKRFQGAITFVDLSHTFDGARAAVAIAEALGLDVQRSALEELCENGTDLTRTHDRTSMRRTWRPPLDR
jgi:predicted ATPase